MKKVSLTIVIYLISLVIIFAQAPQAFKYQTLVRDNSGTVMANQNISFQISILKGNSSGASYYVETHNTATNEFGLVTIEIGAGVVESGEISAIDWGDGLYFLKVAFDESGGTNYQLMGTSQLLSVPYALNSGSLTMVSPGGIKYNITVDDAGNLVSTPILACPPTMVDIDGNTYSTILIGDQCWMAENLKTTTYQNGTPIPNIIDNTAWSNLVTGSYAWYNNDNSWKNIYGAIYNWYTVVDPNGLCPSGWHVPTNNDWTILTDFIGGTGSLNGTKLKSCRQVNSPAGGACNTSIHPRWDQYSNFYGTDNYGFSGFPAGFRHNGGEYTNIGTSTYWWSSTQSTSSKAWIRGLGYYYGSVDVMDVDREYGFTVRCIKD
jgi:uncharacterized protein (TIGR02145 family)